MPLTSSIGVSCFSIKMATGRRLTVGLSRELIRSPKCLSSMILGRRSGRVEVLKDWDVFGESRIVIRPKTGRCIPQKRGSVIQASWFSGSQVASSVFTMGTVAVLPFYTLMVFAPKAELTKKSMDSGIPFAVLGFLYAYLLCLSWTPDTLQLMFASRYLLPELPGIAKMFSNEITLASAWIHLMAVDLFAARQVFQDGKENEIETRHSVTLCLLFCPIGILTHIVTKALMQSFEKSKDGL